MWKSFDAGQARAWAATRFAHFELNASFPDRCMPSGTAMNGYSLRFDRLMYGPLQTVPDRRKLRSLAFWLLFPDRYMLFRTVMTGFSIRFACLLSDCCKPFRTAEGAFIARNINWSPLRPFPDRNEWFSLRFECLLSDRCMPSWLHFSCNLHAKFSNAVYLPGQWLRLASVFECFLSGTGARTNGHIFSMSEIDSKYGWNRSETGPKHMWAEFEKLRSQSLQHVQTCALCAKQAPEASWFELGPNQVRNKLEISLNHPIPCMPSSTHILLSNPSIRSIVPISA